MTSKKISYSTVEKVINNILSADVTPTLEQVQRALSPDMEDKNIVAHFNKWKNKNEKRAQKNQIKNNSALKRSRKSIAEVERSLALVRGVLESTNDGILVVSNEGKILDYNEKFIEVWGVPREVLEDRNDEKALAAYPLTVLANPEEFYNNTMSIYKDLEAQGRVPDAHFKNGKILERYTFPLKIDGRTVGRVWSNRDITQSRKIEETLRLSKRVIEASPDGIMIIDLSPENENKIIDINPAFTAITGYTLAEIKDKELSLLTNAQQEQENLQEIQNTIMRRKQIKLDIHCLHKNGDSYWGELHIAPVIDDTDKFNYSKKLVKKTNTSSDWHNDETKVEQKQVSHYIGILVNISERKMMEERLIHQATRDSLTGLANKKYLQDAIQYRIATAKENNDLFGLMFIDIDRFKNINDTLGHGVGDELLRLFAKRLQSCIQKQDLIARIGGDEFIILINKIEGSDTLYDISKRLLEASQKKFTRADHEFNISASIGIVQYPEAGTDSETLIRNADIAMYKAKFSGRNQACFYTHALNHSMTRRVEIENELHNAIQNNEFELHYQPIYSLTDKKYNKAEALIRWHNKRLGNVSPAEFIPVAEDIGMMTIIGRWVIESTIAQLNQWEKIGINNLTISINVSTKQLRDENFIQHINQTISHRHVLSRKIILEITESFFLLEEKLANKLNELNILGLKIAIDDFGTGYSNLSYLNKLHVSYLKIDKTFIDQIDEKQFNDSVLLAIIAIAKRMGFKTIAEGVETKNQLSFLADNGCDEIQGYYFSKPLPAAEFEKFIKTKYQKVI